MNMFEESGDMLPRSAPKPTTPPNEDMFKPAVPEVSILFEKQNEKQHYTESSKQKDKSPPKKVQTYAAWKKQMLPQAAYPPSERENLLSNEPPLNELYPMRPAMPAAQPIGHLPPVTIAPYNYESTPFYLHNISPMTARPTTAPVNVCPVTYTHQLYQQQRRSLDAISTQSNDMYRYNTPYVRSPSCSANEVLTLCASTQTEAHSPQALSQFATKSDMDKLLDIVQQIRNDQLRLMLICETLAQQQKQAQADTQLRTQTTEAATQFEQKTGTNTTYRKETADFN